jgi:ribosomal protein L29
MKAKEIKDKTDVQLSAGIREQKGKLRALQFDLASGKVKNVREIHSIKKTIARIYTETQARRKAQ